LYFQALTELHGRIPRAREKSSHLKHLILEIEVQWVLFRLLFDLRGISEGEFKVMTDRLSEISKHSESWLKWEQERLIKKPVVPQKNATPLDKKGTPR
jgi:hypothetical protein